MKVGKCKYESEVDLIVEIICDASYRETRQRYEVFNIILKSNFRN